MSSTAPPCATCGEQFFSVCSFVFASTFGVSVASRHQGASALSCDRSLAYLLLGCFVLFFFLALPKIVGPGLDAMDRKFHPECFVCGKTAAGKAFCGSNAFRFCQASAKARSRARSSSAAECLGTRPVSRRARKSSFVRRVTRQGHRFFGPCCSHFCFHSPCRARLYVRWAERFIWSVSPAPNVMACWTGRL